MPSTKNILDAYVWVVNGDTSISPMPVDELSWASRENMMRVLFLLPTKVETEYELRCFLAKILVRDGIWSEFKAGTPIGDQRNKKGERFYTRAAAEELKVLEIQALNKFGMTKIMETLNGLGQVMIWAL